MNWKSFVRKLSGPNRGTVQAIGWRDSGNHVKPQLGQQEVLRRREECAVLVRSERRSLKPLLSISLHYVSHLQYYRNISD
jgi:hypothetical protein